MSNKYSALARSEARSTSAAEEPSAAPQVLLALPDGRWLALAREVFDAALIAGAECMAASAPSSAAAANEPLLDAKQAAARLSISARWLEDAARQGIVPHIKLGRFIRFLYSELLVHFRKPGAPVP